MQIFVSRCAGRPFLLEKEQVSPTESCIVVNRAPSPMGVSGNASDRFKRRPAAPTTHDRVYVGAVCLDSAPEYDAPSYTWGGTPDRHIIYDGKKRVSGGFRSKPRGKVWRHFTTCVILKSAVKSQFPTVDSLLQSNVPVESKVYLVLSSVESRLWAAIMEACPRSHFFTMQNGPMGVGSCGIKTGDDLVIIQSVEALMAIRSSGGHYAAVAPARVHGMPLNCI
ncbi:hypothetical protein N431DRAFT_455012 [Stipitochalara longipes BDJ]|nr:hypothetical protein N431DRAFT_455012 [Stipitochalara longipes BDJ]